MVCDDRLSLKAWLRPGFSDPGRCCAKSIAVLLKFQVVEDSFNAYLSPLVRLQCAEHLQLAV